MPEVTGNISVLVVDDSAFMRKAISLMLESDPAIKVVGIARNGEEAVQQVSQLKPDLVTMDIEMPRMDGLTALSIIMKENPTPVVMVSSLTNDGAKATLDAFDLGAVDFIPKQLSYVSLDIVKIKQDLIDKIKSIHARRRTLMAQYALGRRRKGTDSKGASPSDAARGRIIDKIGKLARRGIKVVAIGVSTGGPPALQAVIPKIPADFPSGILVVQHMPPTFTKSLATRLDGLSKVKVKEAENGEPIVAGCVYIAPGDRHLKVRKWGANADVKLDNEPTTTLHKPSVDVLMTSVAETYGGASLGVILTGMGSDGANGIALMKQKGAKVIAQNEQTCVVYGMPRAIVERGLADKVSPIEEIASDICSYFI
jgi:two-component system chemotaxis response regulator CheB